MQTNHTRTAGAVVAVIAAAGVGYSLRPSAQQAALAARDPAVEVRTVVIRRTIHIVRHERTRPPVHPAGSNAVAAGQTSQAGGQTPGQPAAQTAPSSAVRTSTSHHATAAPAPAAQSTSQPAA